MDAGQTIAEIEYLERIFAVPDIRPLGPSDLAAANRRHDEMLAQSPWFRLWQRVWPLLPRRVPSNPARGNRKLEFHHNSNTPSSASTFQWGGKIHVCAHQSEYGDHRSNSAGRSLANRLAAQEIAGHDPVRIAISPPSSPTLTLTREFVSGFYCTKAQASVIRCPLPVCIAENRLEQRCNLIKKAAALLTRQCGRERIGECVQPPAHSGWQWGGSRNQLYTSRHKTSPSQPQFIVFDCREIPRNPRSRVSDAPALQRGH